jgi:hypothetical protein
MTLADFWFHRAIGRIGGHPRFRAGTSKEDPMTQKRTWNKLINMSLMIVMLLSASVMCLAQTDRGSIAGVVTDPAGSVITGAKVTVTNLAMGTQSSSVTTGAGDYTVPELPAGQYSVTVLAPGFSKLVRTGITVSVNQVATVNLKLSVGQETTTVTVTADAPLLQTDSAQNNVEVTTTNLNELPLNIPLIGAVRDPMSFAALVPGTIFGGWNDTHIEGSPAATYRVYMDGLDDTSAVKAAISDEQQPSVASLGSESLMVNDYSAQYGNGTGVFNYTSKSGTNRLHGSLFNYFQNEDLDAGQPFNYEPNGNKIDPVQRELDFGGTVGGPVVIPHVYNGRNKTFFFVAYEEYHNTQTNNDGTITVPTNAYLAGDLSSNLGTMITNNGAQQYDCAGNPMQNGQIYDPATLTTMSCAANASYNAGKSGVYYEQPIPNNNLASVHPVSSWDPVATAVLKYMPAATSAAPFHNYPNFEPNNKYQYLTSIQLDHYIGQKWHLMAYYMDEHSDKDNADDGINTEGGSTRWNLTPAPQLYLNLDFTETPNLVWHAGMDFTRHDALQDSAVQNFNVASLGLDTAQSVPPGGGKTFPIFSGLTVDQNGVPNLGVNNAPFIDDNWYETLSAMWVHGRHNFVFGGDLRHQLMGTHNDQSNGNYGFGTGQTTTPSAAGQNLYGGYLGDGFASFVLGQLSGASIGNDNVQWWHRLTKSLYANDTWKATKKLTVNLGVRWDLEPMQVTEGYEDAQFSPTVANPTVGGILGGTEYEGYGKDSLGQSRCNCVFEHNYNYMIEPRLGANYQLDAKTVLHAAWGFYSAPQLFMNEEGYNNQGFGFNQAYVTSPGSNLVAGEPAGVYGDTLQLGVPYTAAALTARNYNPGFWPTSPTSNNDPPNFIVPDNGRPPRYSQTDVGVQHEFATNLSVSVSFINNWGAWLNSDGLRNTINELTPTILSQKYGLDITNPADYAELLAPFSSSGFALPYPTFNASQSLAQGLRPFPQMGGTPTDMYEHDGDWWYDGLQVKVDKRLSHGLSGGVGYMWSRNEGTISSTGTYTTALPIQDPSLSPKSQKSLEAIDQPLSLNFYFNYELPRFSFDETGWKAALFAGWTTDGTFRYASGFPIQAPTSTSDSYSSLTGITFADGRWPNRVPGQPLLLHSLNSHSLAGNFNTAFLNSAAWANPGAPTYGTGKPYYEGYRYARTPSENLGFGKMVPIKEGMKLEIRGDLINAFNRWTYPNSFPNSGNPFGTGNGEPFGVYGTGGMQGEGGDYPPRFASMVVRIDF